MLWFSKKTRLFLFFVFLRSLQILYWESNFVIFQSMQTIANYKWSSRKRKFIFTLCFLSVGTIDTNKYFSITALGWIFGLYLQSLTLIFPMIWCVSKIWDLILFVFRPIATYCEIKTVWSLMYILAMPKFTELWALGDSL